MATLVLVSNTPDDDVLVQNRLDLHVNLMHTEFANCTIAWSFLPSLTSAGYQDDEPKCRITAVLGWGIQSRHLVIVDVIRLGTLFMAAISSLLFTLILFAIGFGGFCLVAIPMWMIFDKLVLSRMRTGLRILIPTVTISITYATIVLAIILWVTRPAGIFQMAFGFSPPPAVTIISAHQRGIGDYGEQRLVFTAGEPTINLILSRRFKTNLTESTPDSDGVYRFSRDYSELFARETANMTYNPNTLETKYGWEGVD